MFTKANTRAHSQPPHPQDKIGGPKSTGMSGRTLKYTYSSGLHFRISFDEFHVFFTVPRQTDGTWYIGVPYRQREIRPGVYLIHWLVPGRVGHVALVFDVEQKKVDAAALLHDKCELFDRATLDEMYENEENALWKEDPRA